MMLIVDCWLNMLIVDSFTCNFFYVYSIKIVAYFLPF